MFLNVIVRNDEFGAPAAPAIMHALGQEPSTCFMKYAMASFFKKSGTSARLHADALETTRLTSLRPRAGTQRF
jgi:hypothetical protein